MYPGYSPIAQGPGSGLRFATTRGRIGGSSQAGLNYPSPFFDIAHTYLPVTIKALLRWCRYYFLTNPRINTVAFKAAQYPLTDLIIEHEDRNTQTRWKDYIHDHLRFRSFQVDFGLDYNVYGNGLCIISYPFIKYLACSNCGWTERGDKVKDRWVHTNFTFRLTCPQCRHIGDAVVTELYVKNPSGIRLVRLNPEDVEIQHNDLTGETNYFYTIPNFVRNDIVIGKKEVVLATPQIFIQAMRENKGVKITADKIFHMKRPNLATMDRGWGTPMLLPVLKDAFFLQILKKSQESIALEHIVPLRLIFPQAAGGSSDPFTLISLSDWKEHVAMEISRWRQDPLYLPILPLPIGTQTIGGDGRSLLLTGEINQANDDLVIGMGFPLEFVKGGTSYAGTNVSIRMVENMFIGYIQDMLALTRWVIQEIGTFLEWPLPTARFKTFRMVDDLQRKAFMLQVNQAGKLSDTSLMAELDYEQHVENKLMLLETQDRFEATKKQQVAMAELQGEQMVIQAKYQARAQQIQQQAAMAPAAPGEPGGPEQGQQGSSPGAETQEGGQMPAAVAQPTDDQQQYGGMPSAMQSPIQSSQQIQGAPPIDLMASAQQQAKLLARLPKAMQDQALQTIQPPELAQLVAQLLRQQEQPAVDMRPMPDKLPARRQAAV